MNQISVEKLVNFLFCLFLPLVNKIGNESIIYQSWKGHEFRMNTNNNETDVNCQVPRRQSVCMLNSTNNNNTSHLLLYSRKSFHYTDIIVLISIIYIRILQTGSKQHEAWAIRRRENSFPFYGNIKTIAKVTKLKMKIVSNVRIIKDLSRR